jgi:hypothetical protein
MLPKPKNGELRGLPGDLCSKCFQDLTLPCYISKQDLADICCKTPRLVQGNFCVNTEISSQQNMIEILYK